MITCLRHLKRCPYPSCKSADISLVGDHYQLWPPGGCINLFDPPCYQGRGVVKGGSRYCFPFCLGQGTSPSRKLSNWGSREGECLRSPVSGWDQSDGSTLSAPLGQDGGGEFSDGAWGTSFTSVSSSELDSSKVTLLLSWVGLGNGTHLFTGSHGWPTGEGVCLLQLLLCLLLLEHLLLLECW